MRLWRSWNAYLWWTYLFRSAWWREKEEQVFLSWYMLRTATLTLVSVRWSLMIIPIKTASVVLVSKDQLHFQKVMRVIYQCLCPVFWNYWTSISLTVWFPNENWIFFSTGGLLYLAELHNNKTWEDSSWIYMHIVSWEKINLAILEELAVDQFTLASVDLMSRQV